VYGKKNEPNLMASTPPDRAVTKEPVAASIVSSSQNVLISVIICTHGRATSLCDLLNALEIQTYSRLEVLVIDGNAEPSPAREAVEKFLNNHKTHGKVIRIKSDKGLTRQRNVGLHAAKGDLVCFVDDDVTFPSDFFSKVAGFFKDSDMQDVGGITPYDLLHYPTPVTLRWHLRGLLGVMPGQDPGAADHLGRAVPISFLKLWSGRKDIGWLPGFCMIYRRTAIAGLLFDELLPTYGGEDRDFSMRVGEKWRLLICGDLHVKHHYTIEGREDGLGRLRESSFGAGRRFAKYRRGMGDYLTMARAIVGDAIVDVVALLRRPGRNSFLTLFVRIHALFAGFRSVGNSAPKTNPFLNREFIARQPEVRSGTE
jgi:glycosyltransferase involved in cell wall biosynthesis